MYFGKLFKLGLFQKNKDGNDVVVNANKVSSAGNSTKFFSEFFTKEIIKKMENDRQRITKATLISLQ